MSWAAAAWAANGRCFDCVASVAPCAKPVTINNSCVARDICPRRRSRLAPALTSAIALIVLRCLDMPSSARSKLLARRVYDRSRRRRGWHCQPRRSQRYCRRRSLGAGPSCAGSITGSSPPAHRRLQLWWRWGSRTLHRWPSLRVVAVSQTPALCLGRRSRRGLLIAAVAGPLVRDACELGLGAFGLSSKGSGGIFSAQPLALLLLPGRHLVRLSWYCQPLGRLLHV